MSAGAELPLEGLTIGIDPGHQAQADNGLEPVAPDSEHTKARMSAGCSGAKTGTAEHEIDLAVAKLLEAMLTENGATVIMTRTDADADISNAERAGMMNDAGVDIWIRIHCNYSQRSSVRGALTISPSEKAAPGIAADSASLAECVLDAYCDATGARRLGSKMTATQTGFNWSASPVVCIELGYLSNAAEDLRLNRRSYQTACADGICDGIIAYFSQRP